MGLILDTNAVSALLAGDRELAHAMRGKFQHHLPLHVIAQYEFGLLEVKDRRRRHALFRRLEADSIILCPDRETADWYAAIRHDLKKRGKPIPESDLWIASLARQYSLDVVSQDKHFDQVDRVRRISW
jgi:tRNA(fMet)-specific endonuclease VapC